jgi:hypothetical protein
MKKCLGLLMVFVIGSTAGAGYYDMGVSVCPSNPVSCQNIQVQIQMSISISSQITTSCSKAHYGTCRVDVYENCKGCTGPRVQQTARCDLGKDFGAGKHSLCVRRYINPCQNPKCTQCRDFPSRKKPQFCGMTNTCFNVCKTDMSGRWWSWW